MKRLDSVKRFKDKQHVIGKRKISEELHGRILGNPGIFCYNNILNT
ncbi:MAG: hypothetical protein KJ893_05035 [Candidatus Omnitrophica bacterium]|nr:hypothetical protein [Candidatus Omnitrophota bacterium]MBU4477643.1 hypothetical protein [Candidatus Omnitrophota bacterium]MCG2703133.1 hypothetical protein [Candidatus Omnitrophota bacterium]